MRSKKHFPWLITAVFLVGLIGGAYLVLRSSVSKGELTYSTPLSQGKSSDELLDELLKLNQAEQDGVYIPPEDKNLTEGFLKEIITEGGQSRLSPEVVASDDFFVSTILPYLKSNQIELFPPIPDSVLKIALDSRANNQKYFKDTEPVLSRVFKVMQAVPKLNVENLNDFTVRGDLQENIAELADTFQTLSRAAVPKKLLPLHKNVLLMNYSLQKFAEALANSQEDPLKSLLIINEHEALGEFWRDTLLEYDQASKQ